MIVVFFVPGKPTANGLYWTGEPSCEDWYPFVIDVSIIFDRVLLSAFLVNIMVLISIH